MLYINRPGGHRRYWPMVFLERCAGIAAPYDPWYQKVQLSLALELPPPDLIVAEGGNLTQCSAISRMFGRKRCLAHLHESTYGTFHIGFGRNIALGGVQDASGHYDLVTHAPCIYVDNRMIMDHGQLTVLEPSIYI